MVFVWNLCNKQKTLTRLYLSGFDKKVATTYSPTFYRSTIGAIGLNFSVRNGKRWTPML